MSKRLNNIITTTDTLKSNDQRIREKVKDILNIVFDDIYSNSE